MKCLFFRAALICVSVLYAEEASYGISGNPGAVNVVTGTGFLGDVFRIPRDTGIRLGGAWLGDGDFIAHAPVHSDKRWTYNSSLIIDLSIQLEKLMGWKGGVFGTEFLQVNSSPTNVQAGIVQGYNSLPGSPPLNRSELYQLWLLQKFFGNKFTIRIGKLVPTYHFNNVSKPVSVDNPALAIPAVTGVIYTPIFVNTTLSGAIGGYYNSVYGIVVTIAPIKAAYLNMGVYDGNVARGVQTGLKGPHFNGYYFSIVEAGYGWGTSRPGIAAIGGWYQTGKLESGGQTQRGAGGIYAFGSQALWIAKSEGPSKGNLSGFWQFGWHNARTLDMNLFFGGGLTAFAVVPNRPNDSFGMGIAWSRLNKYFYERLSEFMLQAYYQAQMYKSSYFQPVISYIPNPGNDPDKSNVVALTARTIILF